MHLHLHLQLQLQLPSSMCPKELPRIRFSPLLFCVERSQLFPQYAHVNRREILKKWEFWRFKCRLCCCFRLCPFYFDSHSDMRFLAIPLSLSLSHSLADMYVLAIVKLTHSLTLSLCLVLSSCCLFLIFIAAHWVIVIAWKVPAAWDASGGAWSSFSHLIFVYHDSLVFHPSIFALGFALTCSHTHTHSHILTLH